MKQQAKKSWTKWLLSIASFTMLSGIALFAVGGDSRITAKPGASAAMPALITAHSLHTTQPFRGRGDKCVIEPTSKMRRNHMDHIMDQRDKTVHEGIRTKQFKLSRCINCHADPKTNSVLGKNGFCQHCHEYTAVKIDCFTCHNPKASTKRTKK